MTSIFIPPFRASGEVRVPASKSDLHRLLILAYLRGKPTKVCNLNLCEDVQATVDCLRELGANIEIQGDTAVFTPSGFPSGETAGQRRTVDEAADTPRNSSSIGSLVQRELSAKPTEGLSSPSPRKGSAESSDAMGTALSHGSDPRFITAARSCPADEEHIPLLDARESGSTLRFLLPVACALYPRVRFTARGSLMSRPIGGIVECLKTHGVSFSRDTLPFETSGLLRTGEYKIDASVSSQYVSGLMMASVITGGTVKVTGTPVSAPYIDLTRRRIDTFKTGAPSFCAEGDWSAAAALLCLPWEVTLTELDPKSVQADRAVLDALRKSGAEVAWNGGTITVRNTNPKPFSFDVSDCPDLAPCLAALMAAGTASEDKSTLTGCKRLIYKESNRAEAIVNMIDHLGGEASFDGETITIRGPLTGGTVETCSDHRIAMAGCVAAAWSKNGAEIDDSDCARKSCPDFWKLIDRLRK